MQIFNQNYSLYIPPNQQFFTDRTFYFCVLLKYIKGNFLWVTSRYQKTKSQSIKLNSIWSARYITATMFTYRKTFLYFFSRFFCSVIRKRIWAERVLPLKWKIKKIGFLKELKYEKCLVKPLSSYQTLKGSKKRYS